MLAPLRAFNSKRVQLLIQSFLFLYLINLLWRNIFNPLLTGGQMSFPIGCSPGQSVAIRASKGLDHCMDVAHVAYMIIAPQQSNIISAFLHTPLSDFTCNFSIHNVFFIKENNQVQEVLNNWNIVVMDSLKLRRGKSIHSIDEQIENF